MEKNTKINLTSAPDNNLYHIMWNKLRELIESDRQFCIEERRKEFANCNKNRRDKDFVLSRYFYEKESIDRALANIIMDMRQIEDDTLMYRQYENTYSNYKPEENDEKH